MRLKKYTWLMYFQKNKYMKSLLGQTYFKYFVSFILILFGVILKDSVLKSI